MGNNPQQLIHDLQLMAHPEGGYYKEIYRSSTVIAQSALPANFSGDRVCSTSILFLLPGNTFSAFHRIKSDEIWHFYGGDTLAIYVIHPDGTGEILKLGTHFDVGESVQQVVKAGAWFASCCTQANGFSFVGCSVSPGFDFDDFEMANKNLLLKEFPAFQDWITQLCR
jgi:predicted cupin superfamily sugar epimerase